MEDMAGLAWKQATAFHGIVRMDIKPKCQGFATETIDANGIN